MQKALLPQHDDQLIALRGGRRLTSMEPLAVGDYDATLRLGGRGDIDSTWRNISNLRMATPVSSV